MENGLGAPIQISHRLLLIISALSLYFISGWPARMLFLSEVSGDGGLGLIIVAPFMAIVGFVSIPIVFGIVRAIFDFPKLTLQRILIVSLITSAIGMLAFWIPVIAPGVMYRVRVQNFNLKPTLVSQSLDQATKMYHYSLQLDNKTDKTYENVDVNIGTGFLFMHTIEPFVWTANYAQPLKLKITPGINIISDSIYLGDCKENLDLRDGDVKLEVELVYNPGNDGSTREYIKKEYALDPVVDGVDFAAYYAGICDWFSYD